MAEVPKKKKKRQRDIAGEATIAVALGIICIVLGIGVSGFYILSGDSRCVDVSVDKNFSPNAKYYVSETSADYNGNIQAGSGAVAPTSTPVPTAAPSVQPTAAPTSVPTDNGGEIPDSDFIFPQSDTQVLTDSDFLTKLTDAATCQRAINEIFARHGYEFHYDQNSSDYEYFNSKSWYQAMTKKDQSQVLAEFSQAEQANVAAISDYRTRMGW